jgi:acyl-coenzyme A thioesterase PaaI-like protein
MEARVRASFQRQGMMATLGVELVAVERGWVELALDHDDRFTQQHGFLHAGAVTLLRRRSSRHFLVNKELCVHFYY